MYRNPKSEDYGNIIAKKYYDKLYKEYAIIDLSRYQTGQIGMRWRTQDEVINGKGEQECASKHCSSYKELSTYEVNFKYVEEGEQKQALVKVKCCEGCAKKLNYKKTHKIIEDNKIYTEKDIKKLLQILEQKQAKKSINDQEQIKKKVKHQ